MLTAQVDSTAPKDPPATHETKAALEPSHRSQRPPIHGLPPEVLHLVFLPGAGFDHGRYTHLLCLRMVCKYWAEVIDSTPELWKLISNRLHPELQAMIIRNSGNQLLDMVYDETCWKGDLEKEDKMAAFACLMKPSASRWRTLEYHQADDSEGNTWPLSLSLHNLKRIRIDGLAFNWPRPTLDAPKILHVNINYGSVNLRNLSGLQVLNLKSAGCTLDALTTVLRASPGLKELSLRKTFRNIGTEGLPNSFMNKIRLPQLRVLHISGARAELTSFLLDRIEAPSLETLDARVSFPSDAATQSQLCEAAGLHLGAFPLPKNQKAQVVMGAWTHGVFCGIGQRRILICKPPGRTGADGRHAMLAFIASVLEKLDWRTCEEVTSLKISCEYHDECGECLRIVHRHFARIDQILVEDEFEGIYQTQALPVIHHLSLPPQLGLTEEWLFPKLAKLHLYRLPSTSTDIGNWIVELVKRRKEAEQTVEITELRIEVGSGEIDPRTVEILSQSATRFELVPIGGTS